MTWWPMPTRHTRSRRMRSIAWPRTRTTWVWITRMAGNARYTALLDACTLYPIAMTDALLSLAAAGLFAAKWTREIEREWMAALEKRRQDLRGRLEVRRDAMRDAVPDWEVPEAAWAPLMASYDLPDRDDR